MACTSDATLSTYRSTRPTSLTILMDVFSLTDSQVQTIWKKDMFIVCVDNTETVSTPATNGTLTLPDHSSKLTSVKISPEAINVINSLPTNSNLVRAQIYISCPHGVCKLLLSNNFNSALLTENQLSSAIGSQQSVSIVSVNSKPSTIKTSAQSKSKSAVNKTKRLSQFDSNSDTQSTVSEWIQKQSIISTTTSVKPESSVSNISSKQSTVQGNSYTKSKVSSKHNALVLFQ